MIRAEVFRSIGALNTKLKFAQDMEIWLRTAAVSDVGRVNGPDQAFHRDHAASMSATSGSGRLLDLTERSTVFEVLFGGLGGQLANAPVLYDAARRALAAEALTYAYAAYDRGRTGSVAVNNYIKFALKTFQNTRTLPQWRALRRRQLAGPRLAPYVPPFLASALWRKYQWRNSHRKWELTGLF